MFFYHSDTALGVTAEVLEASKMCGVSRGYFGGAGCVHSRLNAFFPRSPERHLPCPVILRYAVCRNADMKVREGNALLEPEHQKLEQPRH